MTPKLSDEAVSRLPLESGRAELLEEIMSTVAPDRPTDTLARPAPRRTRWLAPLAAAAVVAGLAGGTLWWQQHRPGPDDSARVAAPGPAQGQAVVLDAPGWEVDSLGSDGVVFRKGKANLEIMSYPAGSYASYVEDREHLVDPAAPGAPVTVLGRAGQLWAYSADDHTVIREVEDGHWLELRGQGLDQDAYLALLGQLRVTTDAAFDAALPEDYVAQDERSVAAQQVLAGIQAVSGTGFPDGEAWQPGAGASEDRYQFGVEVVGAYTCAWLESYENAVAHDQPALSTEALRVLGTARDWPILEEMDRQGDYPEVVWQIADEARAGDLQPWYREGLGCS